MTENPNWNELFEQHRWLARKIACAYRRKLPHCVDVDDLEQSGLIGLMRAARAFDPSKGVKFTTYANPRVFGSMVDGIREMDPIHRRARLDEVPRIRNIEAVLAEKDKSEPTLELRDPEPQFEVRDLYEYVIRGISKAHRGILESYYFDDESMRVIGERIGLTAAGVQQIIQRAKNRLRRRACARAL